MRKGIVAILAVAIIGALGVYANGQKAKSSTSVHGASTAAKQVATDPASQETANTETSNPTAASSTSGTYKDGTFTGSLVNTAYGPVRIAAVISGGRIVDVKFVSMPDDRGHTQEVTNESAPLLKESTLAKQSAHIDFVSGATQTSEGYEQSLQAALDQAV